MDRKPSGRLMHFVLVLMLLEAHWSLVVSGPIHSSCHVNFNNTKSLTELLKRESEGLLEKYIEHHGTRNGLIPDDVPNSTISGSNISEKLQDIYAKIVLFIRHLSQVEEYQQNLLTNPQPVLEPLRRVKGGLSNLLHRIKNVLKHVDPENTALATPSSPTLSHDDAYAKKEYGWGVLDRLKDWVAEVLLVLKEAEKVCLENTA
ncbi:uncharacterized protein LOC103365033 [Stegastes partitus]|uniref:Ciliary neurotrophic factor n=1 Tax=Stegastes partitus TaxID=144197 RepID=A0A9Y4KBE5_9TELE|nr:PREDICTED: uncharacterized protein LOC103365033 [Stegastes partitus]